MSKAVPNYTWKDFLSQPSGDLVKSYYVDGQRVVAQVTENSNLVQLWRADTIGGELIGIFLTPAAAKEAVEKHFSGA